MRSAVWLLALAACAKKSAPMAVMEDSVSFRGERGWADEADGPPPPPPPPPPAVMAPTPAADTPEPEPEVVDAKPQVERMVHYSGYARLRVTRIQETLDAVAAEAIARGGRVEHLSAQRIVVRVPVAEFEAAWKVVRAQGDVLDEAVTAEDVTDAFFAVDLRVRTLTVTRDRLVALLAKAETEEEKIALLREIQRVTESLDQFERQLRTLRGLADFSRISVDLVPREAAGAGSSGPVVAGFEWIEQLSPFWRGLGAGERRVGLPVPSGMVALSEKGPFLAESPEGAALWTGRVPNDPQADAGFWIDAAVDRLGTEFASAERSTRGAWSCVTLVDASETPYTWDVCARADPADRYLSVAQAYYPDVEAVARYAPAVAESLSGGGS